MKNLFLIILGALIAYAQVMTNLQEKNQGGPGGSRVVLYWATDPNPFREQQIALFRTWLKQKGLPDVEVRIDPASAGLQKVIIQGTTGVADDLIDAYALNVRYLENMGLVADLSAIQNRVRPTFGALSNLIFADGRLVGYPRNINLSGALMVNRDAFRKVGMAPPEAGGPWMILNGPASNTPKRQTAAFPGAPAFLSTISRRKTSAVPWGSGFTMRRSRPWPSIARNMSPSKNASPSGAWWTI